MAGKIIINTTVKAPIDKVWETWTLPQHIENWAFASDDWEARDAENDVRTGGKFKTTMAARDNSESFDFEGEYTSVEKNRQIEYVMPDGREVKISFEDTPEGIKIIQSFDPENENPLDMQREGWQTILDNYKKYTENVI